MKKGRKKRERKIQETRIHKNMYIFYIKYIQNAYLWGRDPHRSLVIG